MVTCKRSVVDSSTTIQEFDVYASDYTAGIENPLKALLGGTPGQYIKWKLLWMLRHYPILRSARASTQILDYGCGTGILLQLMAATGLQATLVGCDISARMLEEGKRRWPEHLLSARPKLCLQHGVRAPFPDKSFDFVVISSVLHHVPVAERGDVFAELYRVTRPGGVILVFEHNPLNPLTRYVVAHTPIDNGAELLEAREVRLGLVAAGATITGTRYIMLLPPRIRMLALLDERLGWLPLGGQYVVAGTV